MEDVREKIIDCSLRSASSISGICIFELDSLNEVIGRAEAETIRQKLLKNKITTRQLTNHAKLASWTEVRDFANLVEMRFIDPTLCSITTELLIFDDIVSFYRVGPEPFYREVQDTKLADQMRAIFAMIWQVATPLKVTTGGQAAL